MALPVAQERLKPSFAQDFLIGVSLANLSYLRVWSEMLTYRRVDMFWMGNPPTPTMLLSALVSVLLIGAVLAAATQWARKQPDGRWLIWAQRIFLISWAIPLNAIRSVLSVHVTQLYLLRSPLFSLIGQKGVLLLAIGLAVAGALAAFFLYRPLTRVAVTILRILFPFAILTFLQTIWAVVKHDTAPFSAQAAAGLPAQKKPERLVWLLFDEMDQRLAFEVRQQGLELPEFDRLRKESLFATHAYPPGPETPISMPSYITGRRVESVEPEGPSQLMLTYLDNREKQEWSKAPNLFTEARGLGFAGAIIGWYHPYCRVMGNVLAHCQTWEMAMQYNSLRNGVPGVMVDQARSLVETTLFSPFGQSLSTQWHVRTYQEILEAAKQTAVNRDYNLVLIHLPTPHAPHAYDRSSGQLSRRNSAITGYWDSLALADRTLGEIRKAMEAAGVWDGTTVLATSDHSYREVLEDKTDPRVPFLLRMVGQKEGRTYDAPFNLVLAHRMMLAILQEELSTPERVAEWLDKLRGSVKLE